MVASNTSNGRRSSAAEHYHHSWIQSLPLGMASTSRNRLRYRPLRKVADATAAWFAQQERAIALAAVECWEDVGMDDVLRDANQAVIEELDADLAAELYR